MSDLGNYQKGRDAFSAKFEKLPPWEKTLAKELGDLYKFSWQADPMEKIMQMATSLENDSYETDGAQGKIMQYHSGKIKSLLKHLYLDEPLKFDVNVDKPNDVYNSDKSIVNPKQQTMPSINKMYKPFKKSI